VEDGFGAGAKRGNSGGDKTGVEETWGVGREAVVDAIFAGRYWKKSFLGNGVGRFAEKEGGIGKLS